MCLNGFMNGCKFMCSPVIDQGTALFAQRFMGGECIVPEAHAARIVKVLDSARDVSERKIIEGVYGIDMSACKVIITELKIPIDAASFTPQPDWVFPVAPGKSAWIGFLIDDNDEPGSDIQHFMFWPATYGTFQPKEDSALAIFD